MIFLPISGANHRGARSAA